MIALVMFVIFVGATLVITYWAARHSRGTTAYFAANRQITPGKTVLQCPEIT